MKLTLEQDYMGEWFCVDDDTYDGAPDAGSLVGRGKTAAEAIHDYREQHHEIYRR
jgi:hypothetical protein